MIPVVAVPFEIGDGFHFLIPGKRGVDGGGDCSGKIGLDEGRQGYFSDHAGLSDGGCKFRWSFKE